MPRLPLRKKHSSVLLPSLHPIKLILGSQSPRRREILSHFKIPFSQVNPSFDEESIPFTGDPKTFAKILSHGKAANLVDKYPHDLILTADTVVIFQGKSYGKPVDEKDAYRTISTLAGKKHSVFTAVTLAYKGKFFHGVEETKVTFAKLTDQEIKAYLKVCHWADKAGGYTAQLPGSLIVKKIEGCYYNVLGLPIHTVAKLLKKVGIDLWEKF